MVDDDDGRRSMGYYKLTYEPIGSVELKMPVSSKTLDVSKKLTSYISFVFV